MCTRRSFTLPRSAAADRTTNERRSPEVRRSGPTPFRCADPVRRDSSVRARYHLTNLSNVLYNIKRRGVSSTPVCPRTNVVRSSSSQIFGSLYHSEFSLAPRGGTKPYARARARTFAPRTGAKEPNYRANIWIF